MTTVKLNSVSAIKVEKERKDGKPSRKYYTAYFSNPLNPFAPQRQRNIFQQHVGKDEMELSWKSGDPTLVSQFIGKEIPGKIVDVTVTPYEIDGRMVTSHSCVLLDGEKLETILKQNGHTLSVAAVAVAEVAEPTKLNA